jgi:hypothetical protein
VSGNVVEFSAAGAGTITFTSSSVTPPGTTGGGPSIVITAPNSPTTYRIVDLDASKTTGSNPPLTYQWTVVAGAADIANGTAAHATGYIQGGAGTYTFRVTVTDAAKNVKTQDVSIQFLL